MNSIPREEIEQAYQRGDLAALKALMTDEQRHALHRWCIKVMVRKAYGVLPLFEFNQPNQPAPRRAIEAAAGWLGDRTLTTVCNHWADKAADLAETQTVPSAAVAAGAAAMTARCAALDAVWQAIPATQRSPLADTMRGSWSHVWFEAIEAYATAAGVDHWARDFSPEVKAEWKRAQKWSRRIGYTGQLRAAYTILLQATPPMSAVAPTEVQAITLTQAQQNAYQTGDLHALLNAMTPTQRLTFYAWAYAVGDRWYQRRNIPDRYTRLSPRLDALRLRWFQGPLERANLRVAMIVLQRAV